MTKAEQYFIDQMTRKMLVEWAENFIEHSQMPSLPSYKRVFVEHAQKKGWVSADGQRILAAGFNTAAAFLKR